ncbi:MAG: lipopolysaccharide biosynthesis protein [Rubrivivax sp.]|nr:lipopolysaccharide biosynthesis protein [Rubrivivax sp.]
MREQSAEPAPATSVQDDPTDEGASLLDLAVPLLESWKLLVFGSILAGLTALGGTYLIAPTFTGRVTFLPPQQHGTTASVLASLGALSSLAGGAVTTKNSADQFVSLMQSTTVADRLIDEFNLMEVYASKFRFHARLSLAANSRISAGKKDGIVTVEVDDTRPDRAAAIANQYVEELRRMTTELALTEAQQRRAFFDHQLRQTRDRLSTAQQALQSSGFNQGTLRAEPKAAAENYARLQAEVTTAEIRLQVLRSSLADSTPEVQREQTVLAAMRAKLAQAERTTSPDPGPDYIGKFREFKYQETLFDLFSRQYELARLDESREGALVQVIDPAQVPEWKSKPKRSVAAAMASTGTFVFLIAFLVLRRSWSNIARAPVNAIQIRRLKAVFGKR